jgi:hypothetical protein
MNFGQRCANGAEIPNFTVRIFRAPISFRYHMYFAGLLAAAPQVTRLRCRPANRARRLVLAKVRYTPGADPARIAA